MSPFHYVAGTLLALSIAPSSQAASEIEAWPCHGCNEIQFQSEAASRGQGRHYLYDFGSSRLRGFEVTREADLIPGAIVFVADPFEVDPTLQDTFTRMSQVRSELGELSKIVVELNVSPSDPVAQHLAYDVAVSSSARNDISDWLRSRANELFARAGMSLSTAGNLGGLLQALDKVITQGELLKVTINITLVDASKVVFEFSRSNRIEGAPEYVQGSARDVNNNSILEPGQTPAAGEQFRFPNTNSSRELERWLNHMCGIVRCLQPNNMNGIRACVYTAGELRCVTVP